MTRNQILGTIVGKRLGYVVQGFAYLKIANAMNP